MCAGGEREVKEEEESIVRKTVRICVCVVYVVYVCVYVC